MQMQTRQRCLYSGNRQQLWKVVSGRDPSFVLFLEGGMVSMIVLVLAYRKKNLEEVAKIPTQAKKDLTSETMQLFRKRAMKTRQSTTCCRKRNSIGILSKLWRNKSHSTSRLLGGLVFDYENIEASIKLISCVVNMLQKYTYTLVARSPESSHSWKGIPPSIRILYWKIFDTVRKKRGEIHDPAAHCAKTNSTWPRLAQVVFILNQYTFFMT